MPERHRRSRRVSLVRRVLSRLLLALFTLGVLVGAAVLGLVARYAARAQKICPSLQKKHVTPHVLRHTAAMELLQAGVDCSLIAIWLGHESIETTQNYLQADLALKETILTKTQPVASKAGRYRPGDRLLRFLKSL